MLLHSRKHRLVKCPVFVTHPSIDQQSILPLRTAPSSSKPLSRRLRNTSSSSRRAPPRPKLLGPDHLRIKLIEPIERQIQKQMLILPPDLTLDKRLVQFPPGSRRRRRLRDLRDQIRRTRLRNAVHQDTQQWNLDHDSKRGGEAEQHAAAVDKPDAFLLLREADAVEVGLQQARHQAAAREVRLQEMHHVVLRQQEARREDDARGDGAHGFVEGVERRGGQDEAANHGHEGEAVHAQRNRRALGVFGREEQHAVQQGAFLLLLPLPVRRVHAQRGVIHGAQRGRVIGLVFLHVRAVDPLEGVHEQIIQRRRDGAHDQHEEERHLQHRARDEVEAVDQVVVPGLVVQVDEDAQDPDQGLDGVDGNVEDDADGQPRAHGDRCLSVVRGGEELGVLQRAVGTHEGELGAAHDGVGVEVGHGAMLDGLWVVLGWRGYVVRPKVSGSKIGTHD